MVATIATLTQDLGHTRIRNNRLNVIGPINLPVGRLFVEEVITECRKRGVTRVDVLAPGRYTVAVKVIDIFGNDSMSLLPVTVG